MGNKKYTVDLSEDERAEFESFVSHVPYCTFKINLPDGTVWSECGSLSMRQTLKGDDYTYVTRESLDDNSYTAAAESGIPSPEDMSAEQAKQYGVRELYRPQTASVNGERKEVTHVATNIPHQIAALEPRRRFR